jgi:hypothetical protein
LYKRIKACFWCTILFKLAIIIFNQIIAMKYFTKSDFLGILVLVLAVGSLALAVIDPSTRPAFADLAKVAVGAYIGLLTPKA